MQIIIISAKAYIMKNKTLIYIGFIIPVIFSFSFGQYHSKSDKVPAVKITANTQTLKSFDTPCDTSIYTFSGAISGIIQNNCLTCHNSTSAWSGISLTNYEEVKKIADDGRLWETINELYDRPLMPTWGRLDDCQIKQIEKWLAAGAQNN